MHHTDAEAPKTRSDNVPDDGGRGITKERLLANSVKYPFQVA